MNRSQRNVLVVALGAACGVIGFVTDRSLSGTSGGWFLYATDPDQPIFSPSDSGWFRTLAVWFVAIGAWTAMSWWILRDRNDP